MFLRKFFLLFRPAIILNSFYSKPLADVYLISFLSFRSLEYFRGNAIFSYPSEWSVSPTLPDGFDDSSANMEINILISNDFNRLETFELKLFNMLENVSFEVNTRAWPSHLDPFGRLGAIQVVPARPSFINQQLFGRWIDLADEARSGRVSLVKTPSFNGEQPFNPEIIVDGLTAKPISFRWQLCLHDDGSLRLEARGALGAARVLNAHTGLWASSDCPTMSFTSLKTTLDLMPAMSASGSSSQQPKLRINPRVYVTNAKNVDLQSVMGFLETDGSMAAIDKLLFRMSNLHPFECIVNCTASTTSNRPWRQPVAGEAPVDPATIESNMIADIEQNAPAGTDDLKYNQSNCSNFGVFASVKNWQTRTLLNYSYSKSSVAKMAQRSSCFSPPPLPPL